jgi:molybdenum cofactor cytidylyltransferase
MGQLKATLALGGGDTFLARIVRTLLAAGVDDVVVVLGHEADAARRAIDDSGLPARVVLNPSYREGQFSSVLAGLDAVHRPGVQAMLLTLVDVPLVSARTVSAVLERYRETGAPVVRPVQGDRHGHPVDIDRSLFALRRAADPAHGAKPVVRAHVSPAGDVEVDDEGSFLDIDTPDDYARIVVGETGGLKALRADRT